MNEKNLKSILTQLNKKSSIIFATKYLDKYQFISFIQLAIDLKISPLLIGENRVQDAKEKIEYLLQTTPNLRSKFTFVMIGNLQKNKITKALEIFDEIHSVDSVELATHINNKLQQFNNVTMKQLPIYLEVNIAGDPTKHGFKAEDLALAISTIQQFNHLTIVGLMTMPPFTIDPESNRPYFRKLRKIADSYNLQPTPYNLKVSMGTSQDWQIAVEEGADILRIGSTIFNSVSDV